jgi:oxalate decarboxylase
MNKMRKSKTDTVADIGNKDTEVSRRGIFGLGSAALAAATLTVAAPGGSGAGLQDQHSENHVAPNETDPGPRNLPLAKENADSVWSPPTDNGSVKPFKYSFAVARKRIESGGWTRQVTVRDLAISKDIAGVEMRLTTGGVRELHWHVEAEWAIMLYGNARITAVDHDARSFVSDVGEGDLWLFPPGVPHSIQGLGPDGCRFLLVFDDGNFDEFHTFLITDWLSHTPKEVLAKNFNVPESIFDKVPKKELFIFQTALPGNLTAEQAQAAQGTGIVPKSFDFKASQMKPTKITRGGEVKIIDSKIFPVTPLGGDRYAQTRWPARIALASQRG